MTPSTCNGADRCARHEALGGNAKTMPCGSLDVFDLSAMHEMTLEAELAPNPDAYVKGMARSIRALCLSMCDTLSADGLARFGALPSPRDAAVDALGEDATEHEIHIAARAIEHDRGRR